MLVINLLGEAGVGKSVTAAGLFYDFSINGFKAELISEVAKGYAWENQKDSTGKILTHPVFSQQIFILGKQNRWLERVVGKREIAIMECPLIVGAIYHQDPSLKSFIPLVLEQFNKYNNVNILLERNHIFDPEGRNQKEDEALNIRNKMITFLDDNNIPYKKFKTHYNIKNDIIKYIRDEYFPDRKLIGE